jgi:hypothetical protein
MRVLGSTISVVQTRFTHESEPPRTLEELAARVERALQGVEYTEAMAKREILPYGLVDDGGCGTAILAGPIEHSRLNLV